MSRKRAFKVLREQVNPRSDLVGIVQEERADIDLEEFYSWRDLLNWS